VSEKAIKKVTVPWLRSSKAKKRKLAAITAYDVTMARLMDEAGVDIILVGDSLGMVVQGLEHTLPVTLEEVCYHGRAVARGISRAHLVGDMPFMSYQVSVAQAVENAGRMVKEGAREAVKLEGGLAYTQHVEAIVRAGIPVLGHVGLTPQSVHAMGGFKVQGKKRDAAKRVLEDARALDEAGVYATVIEGVPADLARQITEEVSVPTIGIGAGADCDGQILVCYDMLGMDRGFKPKFVKRYLEGAELIVQATRNYVHEVRDGSFPGPEHSFGLNKRDGSVQSTETEEKPASSRSYGPSSDES